MPQLSLYIDEETLNKVENAAKIENVSLSKWVSQKLKTILNNDWSDNYFNLYGSINDNSLIRQKTPCFNKDIKRKKL